MLKLREGALSESTVALAEVLLKQGATVFGRDPSRVDVVIDTQVPSIISRNHATIKQSNGEFILTVDGMNGCLVNGFRVDRQR
jgi:hypothetical protein